ncbi:hypothetical protein B0H12DRAFT_1241655 [Mycena haematopus]|nr:hypothetical protein B0H12DRAFT_1241655 [Mycena haematopus]
MTRVVYSLVVQDGAVQDGAIRVELEDTKDVLYLTTQLGQEFPALPAQLSEFISVGFPGAEDLRLQLAERRLVDIAQRAPGIETIDSILGDEKGGAQEPRTYIVLVIPLLAARGATVLEDEVDFEDLQGMLIKPIQGTKTFSLVPARAKGQEVPILDGCYNALKSTQTIAPPVELFHPVFACFRARLEDAMTEVPEDIVRDTASLMRTSSTIQVSDQPRTQNTRTPLVEILKQSFLRVVDLDCTSPDHIADIAENETAAVVFVEETSELGAGRPDPSVQGSFSYMKYWASPTAAHSGGLLLSEFHCRIDRPMAGNNWSSVYHRVNDDGHVLRVARILHSLQASIRELEMYYTNLQPQRVDLKQPHPRFFPSITSYELNGEAVTFTYISLLESGPACKTFLAAFDGTANKKVVIKFVKRYDEEPHRLLARLGLAPQLLYLNIG